MKVFNEYLDGRRLYVAKCEKCGAKWYALRKYQLRQEIRGHSCGGVEILDWG